MSMNKKEREQMQQLEHDLRIAKALRFTEPVESDVAIPETLPEIRNGYDFNIHAERVDLACTSAINHSFGQHGKTTSQRPCRLFSSRLLALKALRHAMELEFARRLAAIDTQISQEPRHAQP